MSTSPGILRRRNRSLSSSGHPSFVVPKKNCNFPRMQNKTRKRTKSFNLLPNPTPTCDGGLEESDGDSASNSDLMEQMKNYLEEADEMIEEVLEKIVHKAENASAVAFQNASDMVNRSKTAVKSGVHHAEELAKDVYEKIKNWKACHHDMLPDWLKDNEHLHFGHRPELPSFAECFRSIFRIHTETGNIWTHLIGFFAFVIITIVFYVKPLCATCALDINLSEKLIFLCFFIGAIFCLACSTLFHTVSCHSPWVSGLFSRLDYAGIAFLIVGSTIPWLYYGFYCQFYAQLTYITAVSVLGVLTVIVTMWERFNMPDFRIYRTITFVGLAIVSSLPMIHYVSNKGLHTALMEFSVQCTLLMGALYLTGALLYAARIPERFLPGKCDIWFQSHQIFHVLVIAAAFVHYHGITELAMDRLKNDSKCFEAEMDLQKSILATSIY